MRLLALVLLAAVGPTATAAPTISGVAEQGHKLTASPGTWTGSGTVATAYNWFRCDGAGGHCSSIHGATGASYTVVAKDVGHTLALNVRATDATGTTTASTALVGPVAAADTALTATAQPAITGEAVVGQQLTVGAGTWSAAPTSTSDAWYRCNANGRVCAPIAGATAATYIPVTADAGHALVALVLAKTATTAQSAYSTATPAVVPAAGPVATVAPSVAGTALQGQRLVASQGTWTGTGTLAYAYQWYRCDATGAHCSSIHGATAAGYKLVAKDVLHTIALTVRATDTTGTTSAYASLVGPIVATGGLLTSTKQPAVAGTASVGQTLTASNGTWTGSPTSYTYGWYRCNANGRVCTAIAGAAAATYTVGAADAGHELEVLVTAKSAASTQAAFSLATQPIA